MSFTEQQQRKLRAKLNPKYVRTRTNNGRGWSYIEGWHAIAEANRIFGLDGWDRKTVSTTCLATSAKGDYYHAAYAVRVRISVRAGDTVVVRDGSGTGEGKALTPGQAHELALKGAETDATKRALATFGNPFGLALYDPDQGGVCKSKSSEVATSWPLRTASGELMATLEKPSEFAASLRRAMSEAPDIESLFSLWDQNVEAVRSLSRTLKQGHLKKSGVAPQLVEHLKRCAVNLATPREGAQKTPAAVERAKVDKSVLAISEPRRVRNKEHLRFVASHPCLVCGRQPSHAHHLRHAQSRGLSLKVSDEFTVPLCAIHHNDLHRVGNEEAWWRQRNIEPLGIARTLWQRSMGVQTSSAANGSATAAETAKETDEAAGN